MTKDSSTERFDVVIVGAGPSGSTAAALLIDKGHDVLVLERETFPRFSIGESLLPHCIEVLEEAGLFEAIRDAGFQEKNGAAFYFGEEYRDFEFALKSSEGPALAYQVQRARFDKILADEAEKKGADIRYRHEVKSVDVSGDEAKVEFKDEDGNVKTVTAGFILDASGFGRVLPRLLGLEKDTEMLDRVSLFTHVEDNIDETNFDREKILIVVHPQQRDIWYWVIPFSNGTASIGVVCESGNFAKREGSNEEILKELISEDVHMKEVLKDAKFTTEVRKLQGYSSSVTSLVGPHYALLGNAGEFLDPVFSSGVTIAMKSASFATRLVDRELRGEDVDWTREFEEPLLKGVDVFRVFVNGWYDQRLQNIIFHPRQMADVKSMICSILAGYAWDESNPYVADCERRINVLSEICTPAGVRGSSF